MAYVKRPMAIIAVFLNKMLTVFLERVKPVSRQAKPRCIINTRNVATNIQVLLTTYVAEAPVAPESPAQTSPGNPTIAIINPNIILRNK